MDQPLPTNAAAERAVLGGILLDNATMEQCLTLVEGDFFFDPNRCVHRAMLAITGRKEIVNPLTLQEELSRAGDLERVGGAAYIASLYDGIPRFSNIEPYVKLVKDASRKRQLIHFGRNVIARAFDDEEMVDAQIRQAEQDLAIIGADDGDGHWRHVGDMTAEAIRKADERSRSDRRVLDFSTGFRDLDYLTEGLERKTVLVIGAAPGMGKTGLALSMTVHMSEAPENRQEDGRPPVIGWFSMEMPNEQQAQRLLAHVARVDLKRLRSGMLNADEWRNLKKAQEEMAAWRVHFDDRAALTPRQMRAATRKLKAEQGRIDIIVVDYAQLADGERERNETREAEVAKISKGLVKIAKDYNCTVIELSQLNRALEARKDKRPTLGDLRDSGQIAQDAYILIGLYRDEVYNPETTEQNVAELIVLKQRNGPLATVKVVFLKQVMRFENAWDHLAQ